MPSEWTDADLVRFCLEGPFDEVSDELAAALKERVEESDLVRRALATSPQVDSLTDQLEIPREQLALNEPPRRGRAFLVGAFIIMAGLATYLLVERGQRGDQELAQSESTQNGQDDRDGAEGSKNDPLNTDQEGDDPESDNSKGGETNEDGNDADQNAADVVQVAAEKKADAKPEVVEPAPWEESLDPTKASLRWEDVVWQLPGHDGDDQFPSAEFRKWFEAIPGRPWQVLEEKVRNLAFTRFDGQARLKAPFPAKAVLRLTLYDLERCSIFFWTGNEGVRLRYYRSVTPNLWAAHRVRRSDAAGIPEAAELLTADNGRWQRTNHGTIELRFEDDHLILSRGHLPLLSVPMERRPEEITFDGKLKFRGLSMYRSDPLPVEAVAQFPVGGAPNRLASARPADQDWMPQLTIQGKEPGTTITQGSFRVVDNSETGIVELRSLPDSTQMSTAFVPAAKSGLCEFVFRVEKADPGTGFFVGDKDGKPLFRLGYVWDGNHNRLAVTFLKPTENLHERAHDPNALPAPWAGEHQWLRVIAGAGIVTVWISPDGQRWGFLGNAPIRGLAGRAASFGLFALPGGDRGIQLKRVEMRELSSIVSLAPEAVRERVDVGQFEPLELLDRGGWLQRVMRLRPMDVALADWRRACAVEVLRAGTNAPLALVLLSGLLTETLDGDIPLPERDPATGRFEWQLLAEAGLVFDLYDTTQGTQYAQLYHEVARKLVAREAASGNGQAGAVTRNCVAALVMAPYWSGYVPPIAPLNAVQLELESLVGVQAYDQVFQLIDEFCFWNANGSPQRQWWSVADAAYQTVSWAEVIAERSLDADAQATRANQPNRWKTALTPVQHPLSGEVSKEAYNVMVEFQAAISGEAFEDACQVISSTASVELLGLLPDSHDERLMVAFPNAVALAMHHHPQLRASMNEKFGATGRLRVRQAIENGDQSAVESAAVQFFGTIAAADSERWLGDNAMAAGEFAAARAHYKRALVGYRENLAVETAETAELESRIQLVSAMQGLTPENPLTGPTQFGGQTLTPEQFKALGDELRATAQQHGAVESSSASVGDLPLVLHEYDLVPGPALLQVKTLAKFDGDVGEHAGKSAPTDLNWFSRQLSLEPVGALAWNSNRFQIALTDLNTGAMKWSQQLGGDHGHAHHWPMVKMRPVLTPQKVFCRRLMKQGTELICCERESGKIVWRLPPVNVLVSDPFFSRGRLQIFATHAEQTGPAELQLLTIDLEQGAVSERIPVLKLFRDPQLQAHFCEVTVDDGLVYVSMSGTVACVDTSGQCLWVRRQPWTPPPMDKFRYQRAFEKPLLHGESLIVTQPGSHVVECLEARSGRVLWSRSIPDVKRLIGRSADLLVIETRRGLEAIRLEDGRERWTWAAADLLDAVALSRDVVPLPDPNAEPAPADPKKPQELPPEPWLLVVRGIPAPSNRKTPVMVWIDPRTGREASSLKLTSLEDREVWLGPLVLTDGKLRMYHARTRQEPRRELIELIPLDPKSEAAKTTRLLSQSAWNGWLTEHRTDTYPGGVAGRPNLPRTTLTPVMRSACERLCPNWVVLAQSQPGNAGYRPDYREQKDVLALRLSARQLNEEQMKSTADVPVDAIRLFRRLSVPADSKTGLRFRVGHDAKQRWHLSVEVDGERLHDSFVDDKTGPNGWQDIHVALGHLAGKEVTVLVTCSAVDRPSNHFVYLHGLDQPPTNQ